MTSSEAVPSCTFFSAYEDERCHLISWKKRKRKKDATGFQAAILVDQSCSTLPDDKP